MRPHRTHLRRRRAASRKDEGVIIILVAIFLLFVVGAMAALSIDVTTFYTARSEAQLAADGAALAAARALANSGMTSSPAINAQTLAGNIATQVARTNLVGGRLLTAAEVTVSFPNAGSLLFQNNPHVTVQVRRTDLPTFFARIWGSTQVTVSASATAEAYNPSGLANGTTISDAAPVATTCVKPWVLPNIDPSNPPNPIFDPTTGQIEPTAIALLGWDSGASPTRLYSNDPDSGSPLVWQYYAGDPTSFPAPTNALPSCAAAFNDYQKSVAGCVPVPISCGGPGNTVTLDALDANRDADTADAVNCLTHAAPLVAGDGDTITVNPAVSPGQPFQFHGGTKNPIPGAVGNDILVSDSLVTVPVYNSGSGTPGSGSTVPVIGFVQLFLNSDGLGTPNTPVTAARIKTTVVNLIGCGTGANGTPVVGNGSSAVAVRLVATSQ